MDALKEMDRILASMTRAEKAQLLQRIVQELGDSGNVRPTIFRMSLVYGEGERGNFFPHDARDRRWKICLYRRR
jgi:nucleoside-diphosphate-sugar epimerase